jgi:hypothetical protein
MSERPESVSRDISKILCLETSAEQRSVIRHTILCQGGIRGCKQRGLFRPQGRVLRKETSVAIGHYTNPSLAKDLGVIMSERPESVSRDISKILCLETSGTKIG